jgi:tRNA1Val (adenine37-N6)-methyltransferase
MSNDYFQFKQFLVKQGGAAMKVSTDACIQGAWTPIKPGVKTVLDIGTGTGLLSLMLAQRSNDIDIEAIEIDKNAAEQAAENIDASPWSDRISIIHGDVKTVMPGKRYDLIICNPPFFQNSLLGDTEERNIARHTLSLSYRDLLEVVKQHLEPSGYASVLLPVSENEIWESMLAAEGMKVFRRLLVKPRKDMQPNRVISLCSYKAEMQQPSELVIYDESGYTPEFRELLAPFYLKL